MNCNSQLIYLLLILMYGCN